MSAKKKAEQGYDPKPVPRTCGTCSQFRSDMKPPAWMVERNDPRSTDERYFGECNLRCATGGFAVKKSATCKLYAPREKAA